MDARMETESSATIQANSQHVDRFLESNPSVKYIRLQWVDYSGVLHCYLMTKAKCKQMDKKNESHKVPVNSMVIPLATSPGCDASPPQVWKLHPDWETLRICGFAPAHATVMCYVSREQGAVEPFSMCPRKLLTRIEKEFREEHESSILLGFEVEFVLLDEHLQVPKGLDRIEGYSMAAGIRGPKLAIVEEIFDALEVSEIEVYHMHTEAADQLEFSLEPLPPMKAIDALMHAEETIRTISARHGLKATMTPKPLLQRFPTNGLHMHISISPAEKADQFLAGILAKLRMICAFGLPSYDSYHRVEDDGTGRWVGWGTENRDVPMRELEPGHWEIRPADATANFYLFVAVVIAAASTGIRESIPLIWKNCRIFPDNLSMAELAEYGISENLPFSLAESIKIAKADPDVGKWIGHDFLEKYIKTKEKEVEIFSTMTDEERRQKFLGFF